MSAAQNTAVFLSYASQDAAAARRICDALRAVGVEVWFDQNELVGGDAWDAKIRKQIKECALFVPVISAATQARHEGYFRIEWRLAAQRTHAMSGAKAFLLPVVIDETRDAEAHVPDEFRDMQWTRLPGGETSEKFCARVNKLLGGDSDLKSPHAHANGRGLVAPVKKPESAWVIPVMVGFGLLVAAIVFLATRPRRSAEDPAINFAHVETDPAGVAVKSAQLSTSKPTAFPPSRAIPAPTPAGALPRDDELRRAWSLFQSTFNNPESFALAEDILKAAVARRPGDAETVIVYAWLNNGYINRGFDVSEERHVLGRRYAERAMQLAPNEPEALAALGQFLAFRSADLDRAEQLLRRAIELNPHEPRFYRALGYNVLRILRPKEALQRAQQTAELFPNDAMVHYELGLLYRDAGRIPEMERAFDRCLAIEPVGSAILWKSWIAAWVHGDLAGMKGWLDQLPTDARLTDRAVIVRYLFAVLSQRPAEIVDALRALQAVPGTALRDFFYNGPKALLIGDLYAAQGKLALAKGQYEVALSEIARDKLATPSNFNVVTAELWTLIGLGRRDEAVATLRVLISLPPDTRFLRWWFNRIRACLLLSERELAIEQLKASVGNEALHGELRTAFDLDLRMEPFRDDPEIISLLGDSKKETVRTVAAPMKPDLKSVAVLAFANLSDDKANEYFSDGISEELLNVLAKVPGLKVSARTSAFHFKGKDTPIPEIAKQLGVAYVVEGSVRKVGTQVRITAQLIKAADGFQVWTDSFTRELKDIFAVQDEIAGLIAKNLSLKLEIKSGSARPIDPEAYRLYLEGRHLWAQREFSAFNQAESTFKQVVALAPDAAIGHAGLADLYATRGSYRLMAAAPADEDFARGAAEARRTLELDAQNVQAYAALATIAIWTRNLAEADRVLQQALALTPNDAALVNRHADWFATSGDLEGALKTYQRAAQLDPLSRFIIRDQVRFLMYAQRYAECVSVAERFQSTVGADPRMTMWKAQSLVYLGRKEQAAAELRTVVREYYTDAFVNLPAGMDAIDALRLAGCQEESEALSRFMLPRVPPNSFLQAAALAASGRYEESIGAMQAFPPAASDRLYWSRIFDPMRDDPRFTAKVASLPGGAEYPTARASLARLINAGGGKR